MDWKLDFSLKRDLENYVTQNLKRSEILDFVKADYDDYSWSLSTLKRRLSYFGISYIDYSTPIRKVVSAVKQEVNGPGKLLGYRALNQKLRLQHHIKVPRHLTYAVMQNVCPSDLQARRVGAKTRRRKTDFVSKGAWWLMSLDGHDKLCGYQNNTFPLGIYACLDTFSRKIMYLEVVHSNHNPDVIGKAYLEFLFKHQRLPNFLRMDRGTETVKLAAIHAYLLDAMGVENAADHVLYGPSTSNKIERWWRELHERMEKYFKSQLKYLLDARLYDSRSDMDRMLLFYIYQPIVSRECQLFVDYWNSHRIRAQADVLLPTGVPNHIIAFPERYGGSRMGINVPDVVEFLNVSEFSGFMRSTPFVSEEILRRATEVMPHPEDIASKDAKDAYCFLKAQF